MSPSTSETSSFRPTDRLDTAGAPPAAVYDIPDVARVRVWSTGGFLGDSDDPMVHIAIQIENIGGQGIEFDGHAVELVIFHECGVQLPDPTLTSIVPPGMACLVIQPATGVTVDLYFKLVIALQLVASMRASWSIFASGELLVHTTNFVRDDERCSHLPWVGPRSVTNPASANA